MEHADESGTLKATVDLLLNCLSEKQFLSEMKKLFEPGVTVLDWQKEQAQLSRMRLLEMLKH